MSTKTQKSLHSQKDVNQPKKKEDWKDFWIEVQPDDPHAQQEVDGIWYAPKFGCDSLEMTIEHLIHQAYEQAYQDASKRFRLREKTMIHQAKEEEQKRLGEQTFHCNKCNSSYAMGMFYEDAEKIDSSHQKENV